VSGGVASRIGILTPRKPATGAAKREFHRENKDFYATVTITPLNRGIYKVTTTSCDLMLTHPMDGDTFVLAAEHSGRTQNPGTLHRSEFSSEFSTEKLSGILVPKNGPKCKETLLHLHDTEA
jgi:hypothetical protein